MKLKISQQAQSFHTGIFNELAVYKKAKQAKGFDMIDLSIGSPDLPPAKPIMDALSRHAQDPSLYGYTLSGTEAFHRAVASYYKTRFGVKLDEKTEILQLMGSQDGLVHLPMAFADPEDVILVPDPGYTAYQAGIAMAGAKAYPMPLKKESNFLPNISSIPDDIAERAKMMILNFPGNPVPALADQTFFEEVVRFANRYGILVVHDFAYSELVFNGIRPFSFLQVEGAKEVGVEFNSLSKSFNMAGCRIGYLVGHPAVVETLGRLKSNLDYGVFAPIQGAAVFALENGEAFADANRKVYEQRIEVLIDGFRQLGWSVDRPKATMFIWAEIPKGWTSEAFTYALMDQAGIVVTPGNAFGEYGEGFVRIALVQSEERLREAVKRIKESGIFN